MPGIRSFYRRDNIEDSLQRLDKLTQEEGRVAVAQCLKATRVIDKTMRGVTDTLAVVANAQRVANVDNRAASVDLGVASIDLSVDDII